MENNTFGEGTMNTATYEALRAVGATEEQAKVIATAIPDVEQPIKELRTELKGDIKDLGSEFARMEARIERRLNVQTWLLIGTVVTVLGYEPVTNFIQQRFPPLG